MAGIPTQPGRQQHRPASRTPLRTAAFSLQRRSAVHQPSQRAASAVTARCIVTCSALRFTQAPATAPALPACSRTFTPPDCTHYSTGKPGARDFSKKRRILFQKKRKAFRSTPKRLFQAPKETLTINEDGLQKMEKKAFRKAKESSAKSRRRLYRGKKKPFPGKHRHPSLSPNKRKGGKQAH